jgi:hypothetical protein
MKRIIKIILYTLLIVMLFLSVLGVTGKILEDKMVRLSLEQLNKQLNITIKIHGAKVSLVRGFPYASIILKGVEITEGSLETPPEFESGLLSLEEITVKIGILGILRNEYEIDELILKNGWINLYFDQKGKGNFEIFAETSSEKGNWLLDLKQLKIDNITLSYIDPKTGWFFKGLVDHATLRGNFSPQGFLIEVKTRLKIGGLKQRSFYYLRNKNVSLTTILVITDNSIDFETKNIRVDKAQMEAKGSYGRGIGSPIFFGVSGKKLDINTLISLLSQYNISLPSKTVTKGQIEFQLNLSGFNKIDKPYELEMGFKSDNLELKLPDKPMLVLKNISGSFINGNQSKPETSEVSVNRISISTGESTIEGSLKIKNILTPLYHLKVNQKVSITDLHLWGIDVSPLETGTLSGDFEAIGMLNGIENLNVSDFCRSKFNANVNFENISFIPQGTGVNVEKLRGRLNLFNQDITKANAEGYINGSRFDIECKALNATSLIFGEGKSTINTNIVIDSLNTSIFIVDDEKLKSTSNRVSAMNWINSITGDLFVDNFIHDNLICQPLSASFYLTQNQLSSNSFMVRSCGGLFTGKLSSTGLFAEEGVFSADINIDGVDITQLFSSFSDFGQGIVKASNISGKLDGTILFASPTQGFRIITSEMAAQGYFNISNGRLRGVKELEYLSKFISLEELRDIHFETIENNIRVENQEVIIPRMDIQSSAINLSLSGKHSFSGNYIYRTEVLLSDVLFKKATKNKAENIEFGQIEDDNSGRTKLFLKLEGNDNDFKVSYDRASARDAFREGLRSEKQTLKNILREEFSFLRRKEFEELNKIDTSTLTNIWQDSLNNKSKSRNKKDEKESTRFQIEWDDD